MAERQEIEMAVLESRKMTEILNKALEQIQLIKSERQRWCLKESVSFEKLTDSLEWYLHYMEKIQKGIENVVREPCKQRTACTTNYHSHNLEKKPKFVISIFIDRNGCSMYIQ